MKNRQIVKELYYHRNGVSGLGFHVGIVHETDEMGTRDMLVIRFPKEADAKTGSVVCAAFDFAQLDKRNIKFGQNSWRGDSYSTTMDRAIAKDESEWMLKIGIVSRTKERK